MTIQDIKLAKPSKELIIYRRKVELKIENARTVKDFNKWETIAKLIDSKLKH